MSAFLEFLKIMQGEDYSLNIILKFWQQANLYIQVDLSSEGKVRCLSSCI